MNIWVFIDLYSSKASFDIHFKFHNYRKWTLMKKLYKIQNIEIMKTSIKNILWNNNVQK
jgi:hypothetical protein